MANNSTLRPFDHARRPKASSLSKPVASQRSALVLLVVLGMLALFTILAITFLTFSQGSRNASVALARAKMNRMTTDNLSDVVVRQMISGTDDNLSAFYTHGLVEDIYGRDAIEGSFLANSAALVAYSGATPSLLKVQLNSQIQINPDPWRATAQETPNVTVPQKGWRSSLLSVNADTYTGRLITFLKGPLEKQTFRILGYWGFPGPPEFSTGNPRTELAYSIAIDLAETDQQTFLAVNGNQLTNATLQQWIAIGLNRLIQDSAGNPYDFVINDLPFNGFGIGFETNPASPNYGNLDQGATIPDPLGLVSNATFAFTIPIALLPHYDYVTKQNVGTYDTGTFGYNAGGTVEIQGSSNEGFDVPDFHDHWLSYVPEGAINASGNLPAATTAEIIPAFHRPELVNYIAQAYANAPLGSLNKYDLYRMVQLIDYACSRPLSYELRDTSTGGPPQLPTVTRNLNFAGRNDQYAIPTLRIDVANLGASVTAIQEWVGKLIGRGTGANDLAYWDVDNQGRGIADSVWIDPNIPFVTSPDGRRLKPLVAPLILDMDGRLNLNAIGDPIQGNTFVAGGSYNTRVQLGSDSAMRRNGSFLPQGLGYGPAEISPAGLFPTTLSSVARQNAWLKLFGYRYGPDTGPGRSQNGGMAVNDSIGQYFHERGVTSKPGVSLPFRGLQRSRRGQLAYGIDANGNIRMTDSADLTARTYVNTNANNPYPEALDDPYESSPNGASQSDLNFELQELEAILRRYDSDTNVIGQRLSKLINNDLGISDLNNVIYDAISTRSNELRYPNMAAIARHNRDYAGVTYPRINNDPRPVATPAANTGPARRVPSDASGARLITNGRVDGSMLRWIQLLHQERYPTEPVLELDDIRLLFPMEFKKMLRMDLNRPFGNGVDGDGDGQIDEPEELSSLSTQPAPGEAEGFPGVATTQSGNYGNIRDDFPVPPALLTALTPNERDRYITPTKSRKILARQLYCLAQLVVSPTYPFGGVPSTDALYAERRARELAQWAVNVVDFRDTDGANTRFEYDSTPFQQDNGDVFPAGHSRAGAPMVWLPEAGNVVWGMEFPELLLTESLALHDKRSRDTNFDTDPTPNTVAMGDGDFDQYRIPQGSLFLELFNPRSNEAVTGNSEPSLGAAPSGAGNLYANNGAGRPELQLNAMTPTDAGGPPPSLGITYGPQPVFRIAISHPIRATGGGLGAVYPQVNPATTYATGTLVERFARTNQASPFGNVAPPAYGATANGYNTNGLINNLTAPIEVPTFDRIVWFNGTAGNDPSVLEIPDLAPPIGGASPAENRASRVFYNAAGTAVGLEPGRYMVVGPRANTVLGSSVAPAGPPVHSPSNQRIELLPTSVNISNLAGTLVPPPADIQSPLVMNAVAVPPTPAWTTAPDGPFSLEGGVGLNISMPLSSTAASFYPLPTFRINSMDADGSDGAGPLPGFNALPQDAYRDYAPPATGFHPDVPFDNDPTVNPVLATPGFERNLSQTWVNERVAYLQRVADPELPYHPIFNPYITIDWISLDLHVFNGEDNATADPTDATAYATFAFQSRYKDGSRFNDRSTAVGIAGSARPATRSATGTNQTGVSFFSASTSEFRQMLAIAPPSMAAGEPYVNYTLGVENAGATYNNSSVTLGFLNRGRQVGPGVNEFDGFGPPQPNANALYVGAPPNVQIGLAWFNRPFVSPNELMLVPRTAPGQFGEAITAPSTTGAAPDRYYIPTAPPAGELPAPYGFLPAFFSSASLRTAPVGGGPYLPYWQQESAAGTGANWNLILELVETAAPFADAEKWINPTQLVPNNSPPNGASQPQDYIREYLLGDYKPPFNSLSTYRTPGKVNLNTISRREVWDAIEWNFDTTSRDPVASLARSRMGARGPWDAIKAARRGYNINSNIGTFFDSHSNRDWLVNPYLNARIPTQFAGAYRPGFNANMDVSEASAPVPAYRTIRSNYPVTTGLLRPQTSLAADPDGLLAPNGASWPQPVGSGTAPPATITTNASLIVPSGGGGSIPAEIAHNAFVNYQRAMRLPNLVTNQSNVFAVWITIGLFEYDETTGIGAEYVGPSGSVERTKSFYIIDRSIPVGFAPGKNYNAEKTILLRRKISQ